MTTQTEAERLADEISNKLSWVTNLKAAAELRRLVSFNKALMDEVARLQKAVADEREACAKVCNARAAEYDGFSAEQNASEKLAEAIRARGNT